MPTSTASLGDKTQITFYHARSFCLTIPVDVSTVLLRVTVTSSS